MTIHWDMDNGLVHVAPSVDTAVLVGAAAARGMHVGALATAFPTPGAALRSEDPWILRQVVRCVMDMPGGRITPPLAPRAAVGPDITLLAMRHPDRVADMTLRLERVAAWVETTARDPAAAMKIAQDLVDRGATLVEAEQHGSSWRVVAALPRPLAAARTWGRTTPAHAALPSAGVPCAWADVDHAKVTRLAALDSHLCVAWGQPRTAHVPLPQDLARAWSPAAEDTHVPGA